MQADPPPACARPASPAAAAMPGHGRLGAGDLAGALHAALTEAGQLMAAITRRAVFAQGDAAFMAGVLKRVRADEIPAPTRPRSGMHNCAQRESESEREKEGGAGRGRGSGGGKAAEREGERDRERRIEGERLAQGERKGAAEHAWGGT